MVINHNISALNSSRWANINSANVQKDAEKLSSGLKINQASAGAAELSISEKMRSQIRGIGQANKNIQDASSFVSVADGYLQEVTDIIQRIRELSVQSITSIFSEEERFALNVEVSSLVSEIDRIASTAQFNGINLFSGRFASAQQDGTGGDGLKIQAGANMDQNIAIFVEKMDAESLGLKSGEEIVNVLDADSANRSIGTLDEALKSVNLQRASLGAMQNRLEHASKGNAIAMENLTASESRIRDTDFAEQMVSYTKNQILSDAAVSLLSQANVQSQRVLQLLD